MAALEKRRLRVLCLHGYLSSSDAFAPAVKDFTADLQDLIVCECPPHDGMWWMPSTDGVSADPRGALGWEKSVATLVPLLTESDFDGVLGFSQGAAMAAVLCALHPKKLRFCILACGFTAVGTNIPGLGEGEDAPKIKIPSFHLIGERDTSVPPEIAGHLASRFEDPTVVRHGGGHWMPKDRSVTNELRVFLESLAPPR